MLFSKYSYLLPCLIIIFSSCQKKKEDNRYNLFPDVQTCFEAVKRYDENCFCRNPDDTLIHKGVRFEKFYFIETYRGVKSIAYWGISNDTVFIGQSYKEQFIYFPLFILDTEFYYGQDYRPYNLQTYLYTVQQYHPSISQAEFESIFKYGDPSYYYIHTQLVHEDVFFIHQTTFKEFIQRNPNDSLNRRMDPGVITSWTSVVISKDKGLLALGEIGTGEVERDQVPWLLFTNPQYIYKVYGRGR